ncbi:MAG TPA: peptidyl-prolyl cis-trans isomerase [Candidatus Methylomirabilis sp.]|nr:peptidyl-prolyl cis-trans isomerase [Candidatus Methylomirabilis sp.]HSB82843.1 peptidyl-prolyl cis-trans isomerase [Candidatus Methylomirabilis sp.]
MTARALLRWAMLIVLVAGIATVVVVSRPRGAEPDVVARVNGEPVTRGDVQRLLADSLARRQLQQELGAQGSDTKALERLAVQRLINRRLLVQEAGRRKVRVTQEDLSQATVALRSRFKDLKEMGAWMKARGLDDVSLQDLLGTGLLMTRVLAALVEGVRLSDGQVEAYYAAHPDELKAADAVRLRVIAVKDKAAADEIAAALKGGEAFDHLARERSAVRPEQGGDLSWVNTSRLMPALQGAVKTLKPGETSPPLALGEQIVLVRLEERRAAHTLSLAEARPAIERRLLSPKQQEIVQAWLKEQEKQSKIEVLIQPGSITDRPVDARSND